MQSSINPVMAGNEMQNVKEMQDMLRLITDQKINLEQKLMKVNITEKVQEQTSPQKLLDIFA